jgi:hypothetical protein
MGLVTVGCKLPNGLVAEVGGKEVIFNGLNKSNIVGGFGITEEVDDAFWKAWLKQNENMPFVKNGFIFANNNTNSMKAEIKEKEGEKTGLEPLDPTKKPKGVEDLEK